jgi:hypothetical protein
MFGDFVDRIYPIELENNRWVDEENERLCICVIGVSIFPLSTILIFDFGIVPTL